MIDQLKSRRSKLPFRRRFFAACLDLVEVLHGHQTRLRKHAEHDSLSLLDRLKGDSSTQKEQRYRGEQMERLECALRRYPFWCGGHLALVDLALQERLVELAFTSAQAAVVLSRSEGEFCRACHALSRAYIAAGRYHEAVELLTELAEESPGQFLLEEDHAAALIGLGEFERARKVLDAIPAMVRSGSVEFALKYLEEQAVTPSSGRVH